MKKSLLLLLVATSSLFLSGCVEGVYYSGSRGGYGRGPAYSGHAYSRGHYGSGYSAYDADPVFIRRDYVYINERPCYVPIYRHYNETYYTYGGQRYSYHRSGHDHDNSSSSRSHSGYVSREKLQNSERNRREEQQRYQDRLRSEREHAEEKINASREKSKQSDRRSQLEQVRKEHEYRSRLQEAQQREKAAAYRAAHSSRSDDKDKKKKN